MGEGEKTQDDVFKHGWQRTNWRAMRYGYKGSGTVAAVEGRTKKKGPPRLSKFTVNHSGASDVMDFGLLTESDVPHFQSKLLLAPTYVAFGMCPICLTQDDLTAEHVPAGALDGQVLTRTCKRCNNWFGGKAEPGLLKRVEGEFNLNVRGGGLKGERRIEEVYARVSRDRELMFTRLDGSWPDWYLRLQTDGIPHEYQIERRCPCIPYVGVLKNAYLLAICLAPDSFNGDRWPVTELVRKELLKWRDSGQDHFDVASNLNVIGASFEAPMLEVPQAGLYLIKDSKSKQQDVLLRMGHRIVVNWPLDAVTFKDGAVVRQSNTSDGP